VTEGDDWFESAFEEDEADEEAAEDEDDPGTEPGVGVEDGPDGGAPEGSEATSVDAETASDEAAVTADADAGPTAGTDAAPEGTTDESDADAEDDSLFDDDFGTAFSNAPSGGVDGGGTGGEFGGGEFGGGQFGGGEPGGGEFAPAGAGDSFEQGDAGFDGEEFESSIPRVDVGIEGLDGMIQGGVPERTLMVAIGDAGTGKTTFGLQFLEHALQKGEKAVYITLEESHERIVGSATEKGWSFDEYVEEDRLAVLDMDPIDMANSLTSIRNELPELVREFGATRLVLDSVSLLEMMYEDRSVRRNEIYDFTRSLKEAGVTTMLTSEASEDSAYASRHGIIEYLTDAVFVLRYVRGTDDFRETRLAIEIQKIRDANHSREIKPYDITNDGISVYQQANLF
jgi:KaiC domain protein